MFERMVATSVAFLNKFEFFKQTSDAVASKVMPIEVIPEAENAVPNTTCPGDRCCIFYEKRDYDGESQRACMPSWQTEHLWYPCEFGKTISSFECGKNVRFTFNDYDFPSEGEDIFTAAGHMRSSRISKAMEDHVEAVYMYEYDMWAQGGATLWDWEDCTGGAAELLGPTTVGETIGYVDADVYALGVKKNDAESYMLSPGYQLTMYDEDNYGGESVTYTGASVSEDDSELMSCVTLEKHWRNHARSFKVTRIEAAPASNQ